MSIWRGLGINLNFTAAGVDIPTQLRELQSYGFTTVRLNIIRYNTSAAAIEAWRGYAQKALQMGFKKVIWGFGNGTGLTSTNYNAYASGILSQAAWFQAQNNPRLEFQIGNEEELHHDGSMTDAQLRANIRALATAAKAIYTAGPISYSSSIALGTEIHFWGNEGIGALDRIGFNLYGSDNMFSTSANAIVSSFGSRGFVSEWGTNNGYTDFNNESLYNQVLSRRRQVLVNSGITEAYYYNYMESNNKWGIKMYPITGDLRVAWATLLGERNSYLGNPNMPVVRPNTPNRSNSATRNSISGVRLDGV